MSNLNKLLKVTTALKTILSYLTIICQFSTCFLTHFSALVPVDTVKSLVIFGVLIFRDEKSATHFVTRNPNQKVLLLVMVRNVPRNGNTVIGHR